MPRSHEDVNLRVWTRTLGGETFILAEKGQDDEIILLETATNLYNLVEAETYFMDGTFQACPSLFFLASTF